MNLKPLHDRLIVQRLMPEQPKTASGILLPPTEESQETPFTGLVLAVGPGKPCAMQPAGQAIVEVLQELIEASRSLATGHGINHGVTLDCIERAEDALTQHKEAVTRAPMSVKVGDRVIYSRHGHQEFRIEGMDLVTFSQDSVIGIAE